MQTLIQELKQDLHANMNGVASAAMREAGMTQDYRVNFGIELPRIASIKDEFLAAHPDCDRPALAQALWKERVRELRILATLLYPADEMATDVADIWVRDIRTVELAQIAAMNLFSKMKAASERAFAWIANDDETLQICGYYTLLHLLRTTSLNDRSRQELMDQATAAAASENAQLRAVARKIIA